MTQAHLEHYTYPQQVKDEQTIWLECARAAYFTGELHRKAGKKPQRYRMPEYQVFYDGGYQGLTD